MMNCKVTSYIFNDTAFQQTIRMQLLLHGLITAGHDDLLISIMSNNCNK